VRGHERILNFSTLLVAQLQWRLLLREFVRLYRRIAVLRRCRGRKEQKDHAAPKQIFHGRFLGTSEQRPHAQSVPRFT
jgi:hypothetical protein